MTTPSLTNGVPPSSAPTPSQTQTQGSSQTATQPQPQQQPTPSQSASNMSSQQSQQLQPSQQISQPLQQAHPGSPTGSSAPRPRDARTLELLLTAQGVTSYEARVPLLLLDFAYRHTSSVLSDALHLSGDPYTSHAGSRPSATSGAVAMAPPSGDASVSANAVQLAIASRLGYQFRGGGGGGQSGGGLSKEWLLEMARERNRVALPRVAAVEWGSRLPSERFVLSGVGWGLRESWAGGDGGSDDDDDYVDDGDGQADAMEGVETGANNNNTNGDGAAREEEDEEAEGGTMNDIFGGGIQDEEMGDRD